MENSYWTGNGRHQDLLTQLECRIPDHGQVDNPRKNRRLEKLRKAINCYYDLYNNGLMNSAAQFRKVFGIPSSQYKLWGCGEYVQSLYTKTEAAMDELILLAAMEQLGYKPVDVAD